MRTTACTLGAALLLASCASGPAHEPPVRDVPAQWRIDYRTAGALADTRWWEQFDDPVLNQLIDTALSNNLDLRIAAARVDQFLGQLVATRSQLYPQVDYSVSASRNRSSRVGATPLPSDVDPHYSLFQAAIGAQWQLDLFGRIRHQTDAARAQVYASEQARRGVVLTLVTSVASGYVTLRGLDRQLEIARATADNYAGTQRIFELRFKGGVVSQVELEQVQSQYQQALAAIPGLEEDIAVQENLIAILLGDYPGPIPRGKSIEALGIPGIPPDLPAALLERRPDILQAEQALEAANANVDAARALYFPQFSLTGTLGSVSAALSSFLSGPALAWSVAAGMTGPIFNAGAIAGQVTSAEAAREEALAGYRSTVLGALRETNDALIGTIKQREQAQAQVRRVAALREYARLSRLKFENGYAGYLEVLYAENELFLAELAAVQSYSSSYVQLVNVYKAMGGGWIDLADRQTSASPRPAIEQRSAEQPLW
jgi:multidrug efflux system outer membrane protein